MPADWAFAIVYVMVFGFAVYIGFLLGDGWGKQLVTVRAYWLCNLGFVAGTVLLVSLVPLAFIQVSVMGVLAGCVAGLKMGFGESTGPWKWLDNFMDINRRHRKVAEKGTGEAYRRRRKTGEAGPDLISIDEKGSSAGKASNGKKA